MTWKHSRKARGFSKFMEAFGKMSAGLGLALSTELILMFLFLPLVTLALVGNSRRSADYE